MLGNRALAKTPLGASGQAAPVSLTLNATEAKDTFAAVVSVADVLTLTATEPADTAAFAVTVGPTYTLTLAATEPTDTASFVISAAGVTTLTLVATESPDRASFVLPLPSGDTGGSGNRKHRGIISHEDFRKQQMNNAIAALLLVA